jgi:glutathione peroxidase
MTIYDFNVLDANGNEKSLADFKGKVVLIVNVASKCGYTPQYKELETLYETWHSQGFEILAFPCDQFGHQEPGSNAEIQQFCQLNYGVTFPVYAKIDVNGKNAAPLYDYLRSERKGILGGHIEWNFTKFLIDRDGNPVERFSSKVTPDKLSAPIEKLLAQNATEPAPLSHS